MNKRRQYVSAVVQGLYYMATGVWPLIHMPGFLEVTGPKESLWLVNTVGILLLIAGAALFSAGIRRRIHLEIYIIAIGFAIALAVIELKYFFDGTISSVYLIDTAIEAGFIGLWVSSFRRPEAKKSQ